GPLTRGRKGWMTCDSSQQARLQQDEDNDAGEQAREGVVGHDTEAARQAFHRTDGPRFDDIEQAEEQKCQSVKHERAWRKGAGNQLPRNFVDDAFGWIFRRMLA